MHREKRLRSMWLNVWPLAGARPKTSGHYQMQPSPATLQTTTCPCPHSTIPACPIPSPCLFLSIAVVVFSRQVMSNSSRPRGLQHVRPPCPPPSPRIVLAIVLDTNQHTIYVIYAFAIFLPILECTRCVRRGTH